MTFVPKIAGFDAVLIVVVITETVASLVVSAIVVGVIVIIVSTVDIGISEAVFVIVVSTGKIPGTEAAFGASVGNIVSTDANMTLSVEMVVATTVVAGMVVWERVVVKVIVTSSPKSLAGIADPTPDAVKGIGSGRTSVLGFAASFAEYKFPVVPFANVKSPVSKFAVSLEADW